LRFSLLHPSRNRASRSAKTTRTWLNRAGTDDIQLIVSIDDNDPERRMYYDAYSNYDVFKTKVISNNNRSAVDAVNNAARQSSGEILIVVSDDSDCPHGWAKIINDAVQDKRDFVLKTFDGVQKWIITMPVLDRDYYNRFGYVYHPAYQHMFVDTDFTHVADALKKIIWRNDILFPHLHYSVTKEGKDNVSKKADATWGEGKNLYLHRFKQRFGLEDTVNVWDVSSEGHKRWLQDALR
jgi:hypothetical protein